MFRPKVVGAGWSQRRKKKKKEDAKEDAKGTNESQLAQDGAKEEEHESDLAKADCAQEEEDSQKKRLPDHLKIGTKKRFRSGGKVWEYTKIQNDKSEIFYVAQMASDSGRPDEKLVLRYVHKAWVAYDCQLTDGGTTILRQRQAVFRCEEDITKPGMHTWIANGNASDQNDGSVEVWSPDNTVRAETRVW